MIPITSVISAVQAGIPLLERFTRLIKRKPKTDVNALQPEELKAKVIRLESDQDETKLEWAIKTVVTMATVYFVVYAAKKLGVTYETIITLMGTLK